MIILKRSMKTRLVAIFVVTIVIIIGVISLANVVLLPYFYQSNKVSQMQGVYSRVINICENVYLKGDNHGKTNRIFRI